VNRRPRVGVITFPGSLDDGDALRAVGFMGGRACPCGTASAIFATSTR
jgi:hypothetical protein